MTPPRVRSAGRLLVVLAGVACAALGGSARAAPLVGPPRAAAPRPAVARPAPAPNAPAPDASDAPVVDPPPVALLVTLDTTRRDRLGAYARRTDRAGRPLPSLTPHLDALAARGLVFEEARTTNPITLPAHASMLTGTYPTAHGVRDNGIFRVADESLLLAEVLAERGVRTGAAVGALVLDARYGLAQGFEHYGTPPVRRLGQPLSGADRPADRVVDDALGWLDGVPEDDPVFLWVHLFDAHFPWDPPEPHRAEATSLYDGEVAFCDAQFGRLLAAVEARSRRGVLVIVVADHGEGLGDHGEAAHGVFVYDATMHVPLIVAADGVAPGRLAAPVSVTDVAPTALEWFGLPVGALPDARAPSLLETARAERRGRAGARARLPDLARRDEALLLMWRGRRLLGLDDGVLAGVPRAPHGSAEAERHAVGRSHLAEARRLLGVLLEANPEDPELSLYQGVVALALGDAEEAVALFRRVVAHRPRAADAHFDLAAALEQTGDASGALDAMRRALELEPRALRASLWMADRHEARDEPHHAAWWLERLLGDEPVAGDEPDREVRTVATRLADLRRRAAERGLEVAPPPGVDG